MGGPSISKDTHNKLEAGMQKGYKYATSDQPVIACREWLKLWQNIIEVMDSESFQSMEDIDQAFKGTQFISNWAGDFELELANATKEDKSFAQHRIDFCREFIRRSGDKRDLNILNMQRAIAESHFRLGKRDEGDRIFSDYLKENPTWGWGWIGWADEYWYFADEEHKNSDRAAYLLNKALDIDGLEDREYVKDRLREITAYVEMKQEEDAAALQVDGEMPGADEGLPGGPLLKSKIGRNEPCPCGSGKKYKKCCQK